MGLFIIIFQLHNFITNRRKKFKPYNKQYFKKITSANQLWLLHCTDDYTRFLTFCVETWIEEGSLSKNGKLFFNHLRNSGRSRKKVLSRVETAQYYIILVTWDLGGIRLRLCDSGFIFVFSVIWYILTITTSLLLFTNYHPQESTSNSICVKRNVMTPTNV